MKRANQPLPPTVEALTQVEPALSPVYEEAIAEATAATAELTAADSSADWESVADRWQSAIVSLGDLPISSDDYSQAQVKIAEYERSYDYAIAQKTAIEAAAAAAVAQQQAEEQAAVQQQVAAAEGAQAALSIVDAPGSYVSGTCKELKASGVGSNFTLGDANYTPERDRDDDGVACES